MAGLAQKGGAVHIHCRIGKKPEDINAIKVALQECDTLIGGDLVVSAGTQTLALVAPGRTRAVVNSHEIVTGEFTRNADFRLPSERLALALSARLKDRLAMFDASELAKRLMGDSIYSNMMMLGAAWQAGGVPIGREAIHQAIELNGAAAKRNARAFELGRWAVLFPEEVARVCAGSAAAPARSDAERIALRADHLELYQDAALAARFRAALDAVSDPALRMAVAEGYHKVLAYKDEYEVARLLMQSRAQAEREFEGELKLTYHLAPPMLPGRTATGRPRKRAFGRWFETAMPWLAAMKRLRGTALDPFGYTAERRAERRDIAEYEQDLTLIRGAGANQRDAALALARLPLSVRGFGPVKAANAAKAAKRRAELRAALSGASDPGAMAAE
jgi:indolepyruvate ferredoxin oxidoreductase